MGGDPDDLLSTALFGLGCLGVGVLPLTHPAPHTLFAFMAFLAGGITVAARDLASPSLLQRLPTGAASAQGPTVPGSYGPTGRSWWSTRRWRPRR